MRNGLHQLADLRFQKLVRHDQRLDRVARAALSDMNSSQLTGRPECSHCVLMGSSEQKALFFYGLGALSRISMGVESGTRTEVQRTWPDLPLTRPDGD
jgi:hypothetical protein